MNTPEEIPPVDAAAAIARLRSQGSPPEVDDETLALLVESGIEAVPAGARAGLLVAIGRSPDLAALVAELSTTRAGSADRRDVLATIGGGRLGWRIAWAACALLACSLTAWMAFGGGSTSPGAVGVLDGGVGPGGGESRSFSEWFAGTPLRVVVAALWVALCLLTIPALPAGNDSSGRRHGDAA